MHSSASPAPELAEEDVRGIVRLLGEVIDAEGDHAVKKRLLMTGLRNLVDADFWLWGLAALQVDGDTPVFCSMLHDGFGEGGFPAFMAALQHPVANELHAGIFKELFAQGNHLTRSIEQIDPEGRFLGIDDGALCRNANLGTLMISYRRVGDGAMSSLGLYRKAGRPHFTPRQVRIAHIVLTEVPWLHETGWPENSFERREMPNLSRRERVVLLALMHGAPRGEIAMGLGISEHTVNDYVKAIYRHFGVNSRARLLARFRQGDGGDRA